ncbi:MAG TPA: hypothetical protein VNO70_00980, partial [Blastocatellia bacterium]|nr:hypothetical protein [Blastocatellia bacterium]
MITLNRKIPALALALAILFTAAIPASADHWERDRDRGLSTKEKVTWIVGGALAGAAIGGLTKGKKGAAIGAA